MRKKIVVLGDSLSLERETVPKSKTYPELLKKHYEIINVSKSSQHLSEIDLKKLPEADALIFALGVCDSAPRILSLQSKRIISKFPSLIKKIIFYTLSKIGPYKIFFSRKPHQHTPLSEYKKKLSRLIKKYNHVILITIPVVGEIQEQKKPGYQYQAILYNQCLYNLAEKNKNCHLFDAFTLSIKKGEKDIYYPDIANHWNIKGNKLVYEELKKILFPILPPK
jgi:hypothetical protein